MLGKVFGVLCLLALCFGIPGGRGTDMASAVLDGTSSAIQLTLTLGGMMCLWCGILRVLERRGVIRGLSRLLRRPLSFFFPDTAASGEGMEELCSNFAANLLGMGNAATPMALRALEKMQSCNPDPETATGDMITLTVLNTCPLTLIPSTLLAIRQKAGSTDPFRVILPIWISSVCCAFLMLFLSRLLRLPSSQKHRSSAAPKTSILPGNSANSHTSSS